MDDRRRVLEAELAGPGVDDLATKRVERVDRKFGGRTAELTAHFVSKTARSFSGERDHQSAGRICAALANKVGDSGREQLAERRVSRFSARLQNRT